MSTRLLGLDRCGVCGEMIALPVNGSGWIHAPPIEDPHGALPRRGSASTAAPTAPAAEPPDPVPSATTGEPEPVLDDPYEPLTWTAPLCPTCSEPMRLRMKSARVPSFWGCRRFPRCRGTRRLRPGDERIPFARRPTVAEVEEPSVYEVLRKAEEEERELGTTDGFTGLGPRAWPGPADPRLPRDEEADEER